jgi:FkbM family methyltransferase
MRKVFLDCGAHKFEGLREFVNILNIDEDWVVHSFEANPTVTQNFKSNLDEEWKFSHTMHECAVGARDGKISFVSEYQNEPVGGMGSRLACNWHDGIYDYGGGRLYEVDIINLPEWIKNNFNEDDEIHIKLDVEGAEFEILTELTKDIPPQIKSMYIEWHERFFPTELDKAGERHKFSTLIRQAGIKLEDWI